MSKSNLGILKCPVPQYLLHCKHMVNNVHWEKMYKYNLFIWVYSVNETKLIYFNCENPHMF